MKILMINVVCGIRSTGRICTDLAAGLEQKGHTVKIAYGRGDVPEEHRDIAVCIGDKFDVLMHAMKSRLFDECGFGSTEVTKRFIKWIEEYDPDIIHLHNLHGYYLNIEVLFSYLQRCNRKVLWTLHDCWAFTGHCAYFDYINCNKWIEQCDKCPSKKDYPARSFVDKSRKHYNKKKVLFTGLSQLMLVTPSVWLQELVKKSYLKDYPIEVIPNGVNTNEFYYRNSDFKERYHIGAKKIVLGVSAVWDNRKGLSSFLELASRLNEDYCIVLVGVDSGKKKLLPPNIIAIDRTDSTVELANIYSAADVFFNPTLEDNYPTTNLEAIAYGTPVITYATGGSVESAEMYGVSVPKGDINAVLYWLENLEKLSPHSINVDYRECVKKYIDLYERIEVI